MRFTSDQSPLITPESILAGVAVRYPAVRRVRLLNVRNQFDDWQHLIAEDDGLAVAAKIRQFASWGDGEAEFIVDTSDDSYTVSFDFVELIPRQED